MGAAQEIPLRPSLVLRLGFAAVVAGGAVSLFLLPASFPVCALAALVLLVLAAAAWRRFAAAQPVLLRLRTDGLLDWADPAGRTTTVEVLFGTTVWAGLVVILGRPEGSGRAIAAVVAVDAVPVGQFRALRVWLKWRARCVRTGSPGSSSARASRSRGNPG